MKIDKDAERKKLIAHLKEHDLLTKIDHNLIDLYVHNLSEYWNYEEFFAEKGRSIETYNADGTTLKYAQQRPEVAYQKECWAVVIQISKEFGLSPKSRAAIRLEKTEKKVGKVKKLMAKKNVRNGQSISLRRVGE